jgi:tetratricopeptide (TPR) repeat protein
MFFFIPFGIFLVSLSLAVWIIVRKFVYLRKLTPEVLEGSAAVQESFWAEFFPELTDYLKKIKVRENGVILLAEFEKFLRRLRLVSLKIDTLTNRLIHKVRKTAVRHEGILNKEAESENGSGTETPVQTGTGKEAEEKDLKEEEQHLIIGIAKNPKDAGLYKKLGDIYMKTGEWQDASESFKKALEFDPEDIETKVKLKKLMPKTGGEK